MSRIKPLESLLRVQVSTPQLKECVGDALMADLLFTEAADFTVKAASQVRLTTAAGACQAPLSNGRKTPETISMALSKSSRLVLLVCHTWLVTIRQRTRQQDLASSLECRASRRRSWQRSSLPLLRMRKTACSTLRAKCKCSRSRSTKSLAPKRRSFHSNSVINRAVNATRAIKDELWTLKGTHKIRA